ncbi:hypothetical protein BDV96DRAFT_506723, partial [Lophiotrema nucula]
LAMAESEGTVTIDLEKELTCSICTELLYQPLTLLDCLHTFCGACLKEWFAHQAKEATSIHPYTCPSCRASVRTTQRNATITTMLEMFMKANPGKGKTEEDKVGERQKYQHGENVLPKLRRREDPGAEEDRRMLEQVQQMSLREVGIPAGSNTLEPPMERRRRDRSRDRSRESGHSGRSGRSRSRNPPEPSSSARREAPSRQVEHQSSLRSLLSASEIDSAEIEEEIMRQIMEEGLLDGIDLNNIDVAQEDEISERIAQAYRRRQEQRQRERRERRERLAREDRAGGGSDVAAPPVMQSDRSQLPSQRPREDSAERRRVHGRSGSGTSTPQNQGGHRPPVSRPGLIEAANQGPRSHHRRSSSQGSSRSSRRADRPAPLAFNNVAGNRQANLSASDGGERPRTSESSRSSRRRQSDNEQRSSIEQRQQFRNDLPTHPSSNPNSPRRAAFNIPASESPSTSTALVSSPLTSPPASAPPNSIPPPTSRRTTDPTGIRQPRPPDNGTPPMLSPATFSRSIVDATTSELHPRTNSLAAAVPAPVLYPEPQISCKRCGRENIEYELHYNCSRCEQGTYNLCLACYRAGRGCKHWFGFGWAAWPRYEKQAPPGGYPPNHEHPHILVGHRYQRPFTPLSEAEDAPTQLLTEDDPAYRLESGVFCNICKAFANACYWKCDSCNEGAWGYCNDCINQGRHCTHPLLPITHQRKNSNRSADPSTSVPSSPQPETSSRAGPVSPGLAPPSHELIPTTPPLTPKTASLIRGPGLITIANTIFRPLTFTTICNICTYPIPPSHTRYHCPKCQKGDYDICMSCYHKLVSSGRINKEDGMNGWRRCLRGHRMVVVGFQDGEDGQRRIVTRDLVGGWALREDDQQHRFPPDGGVGLRIQALWSYFPGEGVEDELAFPKNAEIRESEDINGDWFWGVYAGSKGLFPGNYGRVVGGA